jgi:gliding motility-associated-like protein
MKNIIFTIFCVAVLFANQTLNAQSIFISTNNELYKTYLGNCNTTLVGSFAPVTGMLDLAFNPNGNLYGVNANDFYQIDTTTGAATYIGTHATGVTALTSDNNGNMYAATSSGNFYTMNVNTGAATLIGVMATGAAGDLAFFNGQLYLADVSGELFRVNPLNPAGGTSIGILNVGSGIPYGLISTGTTCQVTQFLAGGNGGLFTVNPATAQTSLVCNLGLSITGLSSPDDYLASDCTIQIDLDYNNNSGALVHDFNADTSCVPTLNIVDNDVFVYAPNTIDSITISISSGILNGANEQLILASAVNVTITGSGTANLTLKKNGATDYFDYQDALLAMVYQNTAAIPSFGQRQISFKVHSGTSTSPIAVTTFYLLSQANLSGLDLGGDTTLCQGQTLTLNGTTPSANAYRWNNNPNNTAATFSTTTNGTYFVRTSNYCGNFSDTIVAIFQPLPTVNLGNDTIICNGEVLNFDITDALATSYNWQNGSTNPTFTVNQTGLYIAEASSNCGTVRDSIDVLVYVSNLNLNLGTDFILCPGDTQTLVATTPFINTYVWNTTANTSSLSVTQGGTYAVVITDICGFTDTDTIIVDGFVSEISVDLGNDTTLCLGETLSYDVNQTTALSYLWQDGSTNPTFTVQSEGKYGVIITDYCGSVSDSIFVDYIDYPTVDLGEDTILCGGRVLALDAFDVNANDYLWQNNSTLSQFIVKKAGHYKVSVSNACATVTDSIEVKYASDNLSLLFHNDVPTCDGESTWIGIDFRDSTLTYEWSTGQNDPVIYVSDYGNYTVTVSNGCIERSKQIKVFASENCCPVFLPDAFTPNGDTNNDVYKAFTACTLSSFELVIFDRWGTAVFRTTNQDDGWDGTFKGKILSTGVFIWKVVYNDGKFDHVRSGNLTLIK